MQLIEKIKKSFFGNFKGIGPFTKKDELNIKRYKKNRQKDEEIWGGIERFYQRKAINTQKSYKRFNSKNLYKLGF